jgi:osmoprotectant transport system substrate-binding protein
VAGRWPRWTWAGASFTVGSKEFTEQIILGEIAVQALEEAGADVQTLATITGSTNVRTALTAGELDMYWEYTGTGWSTHLQREVTEGAAGREGALRPGQAGRRGQRHRLARPGAAEQRLRHRDQPGQG